MRFYQKSKSKIPAFQRRRLDALRFETLEHRHLLASDLSVIADPWSTDAVSLSAVTQRAMCDSFIPGELIVATQVSANRTDARSVLSAFDWSGLTGVDGARPVKTLMTVDKGPERSAAMVQLELGDHTDIFAVMQELQGKPGVLWSTPNFVFGDTDPRDLIPNDPQFPSQYHHTVMRNVQAWDISLGSPNVLVGITDDGVDLQHQDLSAAIWSNPGEIPGDGIDNDGNGYIDDVNGYNFLNQNNNTDALPGDNHGTHVTGITAATINNGVGTVGTAAGVSVLPLKWYDGGTWTAAIIAETFTYAADNGADIVNTSYNMDSWASDPVVNAAFDYLYDAGVLHFNSAGNSAALNPPRQVFVESLLVASTDNGDGKSSFSNYGDGIDIAAPGGSILSTTPNNTYSVLSGTSMATPNAAGVAALIWSAHPTWSREQVAAQLLATADNIDAVNPQYVGLLGAGRVNSFRALSQTIGAPKITYFQGLPADGGTTTTTPTGFDVSFSQIMDPASVNAAASYDLRGAGVDGVFDTADDDLVAISIPSVYKIGTNRFHVEIPMGSLGFDDYRLTLLPGGLQNPFGTPLDGNGDGTGGDAFQTFFTLEPPAAVPLFPLGSLVYQRSFPNGLESSTDTDTFTIDLDQGQTLTVLVEGAAGLIPTIRVTDPGGVTLADVAGVGHDALAQVLSVADAGTYVVTVGSAMNTFGPYQVRLLLNAAFESEPYGGGENNALQSAEDIDATALTLVGSASPDVQRLAVVGTLPSSSGDVADGEDFESGSLDSRWTTSSSNSLGRIAVSGAFGTAAGNYALMMDVTTNNNFNLNEAVWNVDLTGISSPTLSFYHAEWTDEENPLPVMFTGSVNGDGVSISDDGVTWHRIFNPSNQATGVWVRQSVDLTAAATSAGITLGANFQVKFQQYDNFSLATDGRGFDEIAIYTPAVNEDWYSFSLADAERATIGATVVSGSGSLAMELYDSDGTLLATGSGTENVSSIISQFQDPTNDGDADRYFARVVGSDVSYSMLVTRNAGFDTEPNNSSLQPQPLSGLRGVLGYASSQLPADVYSLTLAATEQLSLAATLPAGGPNLFDNQLATPAGSALVMELRDPMGNPVGTDSSLITYTATMTGEYTLTVSASQAEGEYAISIDQSLVTLPGDFDNDGDYDCDDIDALVAAIAGNSTDLLYDLTGDGQVSLEDLDLWRVLGGAANLPSGNAYLPGDATLDGTVDGEDFLAWNAHKFSTTAAWCQGDFNADGNTDGADFIIWNANKFTSALLVVGRPPAADAQTDPALAADVKRPHADQLSNETQVQSVQSPVIAVVFATPFDHVSSRRQLGNDGRFDANAAIVDAIFAQPISEHDKLAV